MRGAFERLVVPISGSAEDARAFDALPALIGKEGGAVTFLYVVEVPQSMPLDAELPAEIDEGERALREAERITRKRLHARSTHVVTELLQARAAGPAIVDEAIEREADAILMTSSIHRKHGRATLGETTDHVLLHAPCEVVVIRLAPPRPPLEGADSP
ncbi:MAG: universal stress protein [Thermomicrobiales bacterium]|nr:universal stress protein [Thermomicrobiales bacterium]